MFDSDKMERQVNGVAYALHDELDQKVRLLSRSGAPFSDAWEYVSDTVTDRWNPMVNDFRQAYRRNEFFMKDICEAGQEAYDQMKYVKKKYSLQS